MSDESETNQSEEAATSEPGSDLPPSSSRDVVEEPETEPEPDPLEVAQADLARARESLLRTAADFDNFRKRTRKELIEAEHRGRDDLLRELLPVFDNLERAEAHAQKATEIAAVAEGVRMVLRMFQDSLAKIDVHRIDSVGVPFDPSIHEAIQQIETTEHPPGSVAAEVQPGYRSGERLIRPAMVVVARPPSPDSDAG